VIAARLTSGCRRRPSAAPDPARWGRRLAHRNCLTTPAGRVLAATRAGLVLALAAVSVLAVPAVAKAQPAGKIPRVGYLSPASASDVLAQQSREIFRQQLRELGHRNSRSGGGWTRRHPLRARRKHHRADHHRGIHAGKAAGAARGSRPEGVPGSRPLESGQSRERTSVASGRGDGPPGCDSSRWRRVMPTRSSRLSRR
jgi:hypothetical protein